VQEAPAKRPDASQPPPVRESAGTAAPAAAPPARRPTPKGAEAYLEVARAKINNNLLEAALGDLRQVTTDFPGTPAAAEASYLSAEVLEKLGRLDDAMATHVEFGKRFANDRRTAASQLRLAELTERSRRPNREAAASNILGDLIRTYPRTPEAMRALQMKIRLDQGNRQRVMDPVIGVQVPPVLPTLRTLVEQFPNSPMAMIALNRLANMYGDLDQFQRAAEAYAQLATSFPNNPHDAWFRAGEIYERRLKDLNKAREAFARVPEGSPRYRDAQKKLTRRP
jgi:TolA-binding protein